jgi:hypothetical protein
VTLVRVRTDPDFSILILFMFLPYYLWHLLKGVSKLSG